MCYVKLKQFEIIKKVGTSILINESIWADTSTVSSCGGIDLEDVCLLPQSNCPRFVLLCQDALTSAKHNCAQLSLKVAAMWHDLQGIWGLEMC